MWTTFPRCCCGVLRGPGRPGLSILINLSRSKDTVPQPEQLWLLAMQFTKYIYRCVRGARLAVCGGVFCACGARYSAQVKLYKLCISNRNRGRDLHSSQTFAFDTRGGQQPPTIDILALIFGPAGGWYWLRTGKWGAQELCRLCNVLSMPSQYHSNPARFLCPVWPRRCLRIRWWSTRPREANKVNVF